jgi:signal peptidase I
MYADGSEINRRRRIRWSAVLLSLVLTPVAGYVAVGRWRRGLGFLGFETGYLAVCVGAALAVVPYVMYAGIALGIIHWLSAFFDVARLSKRGTSRPAWPWVVVAGLLTFGFAEGLSRAVRAFLVDSFGTAATSMVPTLEVGEHIMVGKRHGTVRRGEIVVFDYPTNPSLQYVMRVAAVGGDTVTVEAGDLLINGQPPPAERQGVEQRQDPVMGEHTVERWRETVEGRSYMIYRRAGPLPVLPELRVPDGHVFVLGDNRDNSNDSRTWGTLPLEFVRGQALFIWWSKGKEGLRWPRMNKRLQ